MSDDIPEWVQHRGAWVVAGYGVVRWALGWHFGKLDRIEKKVDALDNRINRMEGVLEEHGRRTWSEDNERN